MGDWAVTVSGVAAVQSTWNSHKLRVLDASVTPLLMGFSMLTMNSSRPAGGTVVPSTSAGIKLWPRKIPLLQST